MAIGHRRAGSARPGAGVGAGPEGRRPGPGKASYLNTLGVALYHAGQYAEAVATLEKSLAAGKSESDAFDLFFLAMARYRLSEIARARADFDRAVKWRREHLNLTEPRWNEELDAFQAEARALLGSQPLELPPDVFAPAC